ncbi:nodulation-signaling pathway 1 protein-like [Hordeum vulgare]|nr:nodulation-signaling pathway 1 protein-like [Hordeum vulgare]
MRVPDAVVRRAEPRMFRASLIKFHEVSPWFTLPNTLANAAISQLASAAPRPLHLVDIDVSHEVQWPTLLESLTRMAAGRAPPFVQLTVVATPPVPFSASPPGYDFSPHLLRYAKSIKLDFEIGRAASLDSAHGFCTAPDEALVVCLQFRLGHVTAEERTDIIRRVKDLKPQLVVLSELDVWGNGSAAGEFTARLELLWRFLESTHAAFKGRDGEDRRLLEAEAGSAVAVAAAREAVGREGWRDCMTAAGFDQVAFGGEAVESARSLLRKYDNGWEMSTTAAATGGGGDGALRWKGQPVSFCSLWWRA